jgi:membrane-associated PAP2 superfamily phosphatase
MIFKLIVGHDLRLSAAGIGLGILTALDDEGDGKHAGGCKGHGSSTFLVMALLFFAVAALRDE